MSATFQASHVETIVRRGWRRRLLVLTVEQAAIGLAVIFGGLALLMVLGLQVLSWPWLLLIAAVGIGLTVFAVRRRLLDAYSVAQVMDKHLALQDSLSTAWFLHQQDVAEDQAAATFQLHHAEEAAQNADLAAAFPFAAGRPWIVTALCFVLAFGLFSARYLVTHNLNLERPFLPLAMTQVFEYIRDAGSKTSHTEQAASGVPKGLPPAVSGQEAAHRPPAAKPEPGQNPAQRQAGGHAGAKGDNASDQDAQQAKSAEGEGGDAKRDGSGEGSKSGSNAEAKQQASANESKQEDKQSGSEGQQRSENLMARMRDAVSSVMAKMKPSSGTKDSQPGAQKSSDGQKSPDQAGSKDQNSDSQKDSGKEESAQEQSAGQQQGQGSAKAQASGKDSAQASDKKGSDAQSGVGHSDGDKEVKAAEQAKAMGKLAEIIGKRSASLTGDMQIEPSGKQRLQTGYTHQQGRHADLGGEINRDEVPVEDQEYVREYMELVRKKPSKSTTSH